MPDTKQTKTIGEHWVCTTLARLGWAPALTRDAIERTDILAVATQNADRPRIEIQVKAANVPMPNSQAKFQLYGVKDEIAKSDHEWFAFVLIPPYISDYANDIGASLQTFIVPRNHVCAAVWVQWRHWLNEPGVRKPRNSNSRQAWIYCDTWQRYEERWNLLGTPTNRVPVMLDKWHRDMTQDKRIGLPPGHPWTETFPEWPVAEDSPKE